MPINQLPGVLTLASGGGPNVQLHPDSSALPGGAFIQQFANGLASWGLIAAMIGIIVGAIVWAFGHYSQNYQQSINGRKGVMVSGLAALLIGAAPFIINDLFGKGVNIGGAGL